MTKKIPHEQHRNHRHLWFLLVLKCFCHCVSVLIGVSLIPIPTHPHPNLPQLPRGCFTPLPLAEGQSLDICDTRKWDDHPWDANFQLYSCNLY